MHRSRALAVIGALAAAAGLLLPFVTIPPLGALDGRAADAWPAAVLAALAAAAAMAGDRGDAPTRPAAAVTTVLAAGGLGFATVKVLDAWWAAGAAAGAVGSGAWVVTAGTAVTLVGAVLGFGRRI